MEFRCDGKGRRIQCSHKGGWAFPYHTYVGCCLKLCREASHCPLLTKEERRRAKYEGYGSLTQPKIPGLEVVD